MHPLLRSALVPKGCNIIAPLALIQQFLITESDQSDSMASECPFIVIDELDDYDDEDDVIFIKKPRTEHLNGTDETSSNAQNVNDTNSDSESEDSVLDEIQKAKDDDVNNEHNEDVVFIDVKGD